MNKQLKRSLANVRFRAAYSTFPARLHLHSRTQVHLTITPPLSFLLYCLLILFPSLGATRNVLSLLADKTGDKTRLIIVNTNTNRKIHLKPLITYTGLISKTCFRLKVAEIYGAIYTICTHRC